MGSKRKLLIADDHALIRNGLRQVLEVDADFEITEAENGEEALKLIRNKSYDAAILDIEMPKISGFEIARKVHNESISLDIIFLTMFKDESMFNNAMDIGVKGYVLKENTVSEIVKCVETVLAGSYYLSPAISEFLIRRNNKMTASAADKKGMHQLTPSEKTVMKLVATMKTSQEMADQLGVSVKTIQNHRNNICNKLDISGTHALLKFAVENADRI